MKFALTQDVPCDPISTGVTPQLFQRAMENGMKNPESCLCSSPCTPDKAAQFIRFLYIKRFNE